VLGLLLLKHIYAPSDEGVCDGWVHDPISNTSPGRSSFSVQHAFPHERSDLGHWSKRLGDRVELPPAESLRVAH
jgi:IS5 family transposase